MENKLISLCLQILSLFLQLIFTFATKTFPKLLRPINLLPKQTPPLPPGPTGWPIIGSLPEMSKNRPAFRWIHKQMQENNTEIACIQLGKTHVIPVASPELAREFLRKHDQTFASRPFCMTAKLTSDNYLTTVLSPTGNQWKKMRKIVSTKILSPTMHQFLHGKRLQEDDHLVRYAYNQCRESNHGLVNIRAVAQHYCANVTRRMVFGKRFFGPGMEDGGPGKEEIEHVDALFTILKYLYGFAIADYVPWLEVFDFDGYKRFISNAIHSVRKYQDPEIMNRVEMWRQGIKKTEEDILDVLINLKDSENNRILSVQEISAQIIEIMIAAVDNPSNAVEWGIAEIINQPHILNKAHEELDQVVGRDRLVQESDLPKLNYIKSCIKESFRLHPVAPFIPPHVSSNDVTVGGYLIPKGSQIMLSRMGLGRNPRVWNDPLEYKPERHIVNGIEKQVVLVDNELNVLSFSTGRRGCPGVVLGSTMSTMLLARLLQSFNFTTPLDGVKVDLSESDGGLQLAKPLVARAEPRLEPHIYLRLI